ncbi:MAG: hypothetical protein ACRETO_07020 [Gammaproteobacteria bacterium]
MKTFNLQSLIVITLALAGCASTGDMGAAQSAATNQAATATAESGVASNNAKPGKDSDMICTTGMEIGSHIPQRTCYTRKEAEKRKQDAQQAIRNMDSGPKPGAGCSPSC